jgi:predicted nucleotidyltransferase
VSKSLVVNRRDSSEQTRTSLTTDKTVQKCKDILKRHYGPQLKGMILYGSVAREQTNAGSDIDLLVLLSEPFDYLRELHRIVALLYPVQLESEHLISAKPAAETAFEIGSLQLYRNAKREGKRL